jgi:transmembrane sensor
MTQSERDSHSLEDTLIHERAAEWVVRVQDSNVSLQDTLAWQAWMKEDPRHRQAFAHLEELSRFVKEVRPPREPSIRELARDSYDGSTSLAAFRTQERRSGERAFALAIAASIVMIAIGLIVWSVGPMQVAGGERIVSTAVGENRVVSLDDGSQVVLGGNTTIAVSLRKDVRSIELLSGEAFFTVAKDANRPFKVHAGDATVVAVGTEFNVRRTSDRAFVAVVEGRVIVEPASHLVPTFFLREFKPKMRPVPVDAGQQTTAGSAGIELASAIEETGAVTAWKSGRLAFRLQPLRYVLEDVNRYSPKPIVVDDASIANLTITGAVTSDNIGGWISSLERGFGLVATQEPDRIVLRRR